MHEVKTAGARIVPRHRWTEEEDATLIELWPVCTRAALAEQFGVSVGVVYRRAKQLGLPINSRPHHTAAANAARANIDLGRRIRPIGAERVDKDNVLYRKVSSTGEKRKDWRPVHLLNWEAEHGPVPDGHILVFVDGDKENLALSNLMLIDRAENMARNSVARYGPEIQSIAITLGKFKSKLKKLERENAKSK